MSKKSNNNLLDAESAVADFLDVLLQEATEPTPAAPRVIEKAKVLLMPDIELTPPAAPAAKPQADDPPAETAIETKVEAPAPAQEAAVLESSPEPAESELQGVQRYQFPLQCLMFNVGDNQLSIPLIDLGGVLPWKDRLTQLPDAPDWFLGILQHRDVNVKVADTAKILCIPTSAVESASRHLLVFGDETWAISCDKLGQVLHLERDDVQWTMRESGSLSLGTIRESLAILLDPKKILKQLNAHPG